MLFSETQNNNMTFSFWSDSKNLGINGARQLKSGTHINSPSNDMK
jgi:hypothetical protein